MDNNDPGDDEMIARLIKFFRRPTSCGQFYPSPFDFWIADRRRTIEDFFTPPLSDQQWIDLRNRFPKLARLYERDILSEGETIRAYRTELAFLKANPQSRAL